MSSDKSDKLSVAESSGNNPIDGADTDYISANPDMGNSADAHGGDDGVSPRVIRKIVSYVEARSYSGPIPPPEIIREYEEIWPGAAELILKNFDRQSSHRQSIEKHALAHNNARSWGGLVGGTLVVLAAMGLSAYLIYKGQDGYGVALVITSLGGLAGVFVLGKLMSMKSLSGKLENLQNAKKKSEGLSNQSDAKE